MNDHAHEPLTDETTWLLAQRKPTLSPTPGTSSYLLTGIVRCAECRYSMRAQKARGKTIGTYRCVTETASGRCPHPSSVSMKGLDDFVLEAWIERAAASVPQARIEGDDSAARAALAEAQSELDEVNALEGELRPAVFAQAQNAALDKVEEAQQALAEAKTFDDRDAADLVNTVLPLLRGRYEVIGGELVKLAEPRPEEFMQLDSAGLETIREALARDIQAVMVRPAASRSKNLPISDRVHIVWRGEEELELPRRGTHVELPPYEWEEASA